MDNSNWDDSVLDEKVKSYKPRSILSRFEKLSHIRQIVYFIRQADRRPYVSIRKWWKAFDSEYGQV